LICLLNNLEDPKVDLFRLFSSLDGKRKQA
jgi:hypothetical protein